MPNPPSTFPAPIYRDTVLCPIFTDAKKFFLEPLLQIHYAHTLMLARQRILTKEQAVALLRALDSLDLDSIRHTEYDGTCEDLFFLIERKLAEQCGPETGGRMHTARSRNDIDLTMYRLVLRDRLTRTMHHLITLRDQLLTLAEEHRASLIPAYTHGQPAQPTTLGHYLMAIIECFERDHQRLQQARTTVNRSPMGACAITTTGFPIDRHHTASLLGFDALALNSYGAIASVDYLTESCAQLAVLMLNLGRLAQDLLQWSSVEFAYLRLSDGYVQISSIMPQKRNPVALEHVRILAGRALTQSHAIISCLHNTPFTDINDSEDDLQPLVYTAFDDAARALQLLTGLLSEAAFDTDHMASAANANFLPVTELADTLVRTTGMSFHHAHQIVSAAVKSQQGHFDPTEMASSVHATLTAPASLAANDSSLPLPSLEALRNALDAAHFVAIRTIPGGPALEALDPELARARALLQTDTDHLTQQTTRLTEAATQTRREADHLLTTTRP